ncbi:MAG TPA: glycoside hydrolase family 2 protein [Anaerolineae bacterium]|nr:glycoside hydrolase family 2 protein [Anaerolineae bacterium]
MMQSQSLASSWQFRQTGTEEWRPATVPGGVHTDLLALDLIPDPFVSDNEKRMQWVAESDWEYRRSFTVDPIVLAHDKVYLVCDGLDTLADVYLNDQLLAHTDNMFRQYRWDVKPQLLAGENDLHIVFRSPVAYITAQEKIRSLPGVGDFAIRGGSHIRKANCQFGWDWGTMLPAIGIWRDIRLEAHSHARLADVHVRQHHEPGQVTVSADVTVESWGDAARSIVMRLTAPDGSTRAIEAALDQTLSLPVDHPQLWWPNSYGDQPLYQVEVELRQADQVLDRRVCAIGLRTIELRQQYDRWGQSFTFVVNGVPIFAKGSNWIPSDSFPTRITDAQLEFLIASAAQANHNMLRVWGGGYYEDETFYDLCDRYGLLVWQDFMFACAGYPLHDETFLANLKVEVEQNVRRLRHHACLALWCGNNEMEGGWIAWNWDTPANADLKAADQEYFYGTLPTLIATLDPDHAYWPSSPSSGLPHEDPNSNSVGDNHLWEVWHGLKPLVFYREQYPRFASEFGMQSLPALATVATYAEPEEWNMMSYVMEHHQRHMYGNGKIIAYLTQSFCLPTDFPSLVYATQILQAEAMRMAVEHWRRNRERCSGALYWQINDCWPVASWSSIDYFGRWKALHYASRRFYAPILLSVVENGDRMGLFLTNDTPQEWSGQVHWSLQSLHGEVLEQGSVSVNASPLATTTASVLDFAARVNDDNRRDVVLACELWHNGARTALTTTLFVPDKHARLQSPKIEAQLDLINGQLQIQLQAQSLARFVEVALDGADVIFSDNYFDLPARQTITVTCPLPSGWTIAQARQALRVRSLRDSY